ncbi:GcrA family cell cycle regulator [Mesorhizobium sp.]|uniref:GcrA family cell cycle regulator n=1 Tax=Mesorhizobium sp. TaxID=1871066 RepID=UPI0025BE29CC|nr:GcrA family cell cycle regulator [Mesorhizobium sp.]
MAAKFVNCSRSAVIGLVHRLKLQFNNGVPRKGKVGRRPASEAAAPKPPKAPAVRRVSKLVQQNVSWRGANNPHRNDIKGRIEQRAASPGLPAHLVAGEPRRPVNDLNIVPVSRNLKLIELTEQTCKWPIGDPQSKDFGFCGNDAQSTRPYCRYHTRISYEPLTTRQSAGLRSAERIS